MASLTKKERDALPDSDFAVPGKRKLPINDERHVSLAHDMLGRTQGLTPEEKKVARERILEKAKQLGIDTSDWDKVEAAKMQAAADLIEFIRTAEDDSSEDGVDEVIPDPVRAHAMAIEAMSLNISNSGHLNKMPFSGILTRIGEPSDKAPQGADGRRVILTRECAEAALESLLGMAVDYTPFYDGHDSQAKIGIITSANIVGNAVVIEGFVYASDFPEQAAFIREHKDVLGFSFEADDIWVTDPNKDPLEIAVCTFTGAAILRKDKAAYQSTSIAASAENKGLFTMDKTELLAVLGEAFAPVTARLDAIEASAKASDEANKAKLDAIEAAAKEVATKEAPKAPEAPAVDPKLADLEKQVADMKAAAEKTSADAIAAAVAEATKSMKDELASMTTKLEDVKASARTESQAPDRKTLTPQVTALLSRAGIELPKEGSEGGKISASSVDELLRKANISDISARIAVKRELDKAGFIAS